ncbi:ribosomal protein L1p/L10e family-domain-containing protein [Mycena sp. CBHHK59/15]|nr:ribosomal protein L1p/L10e family-domain-containing protein [Mycena sp. CBHHK59/15]
MAKDDLIDSHVSLKQCKLAVEALHAHSAKLAEKQQAELLPGKEQNIWLNVTVKKIASVHKFKPVKIPIVHPLVDPRTSAVCLITKDPQRQYKDLLTEHNIKFISRVVGIEKLKGKFKPFEARRMLLKENGLFLADERVVPLLPKLLGVKWFEAKKQPIPVCLTRKDLKGELERAISSTYMNQNQGTCTAIKISTISHKPSQVLENLQAALPTIVKSIKGGWDNVQSLIIKTNSSVGLPIWSCDLGDGEGGRWSGLVAQADGDVSSGEADDEMDVVEDKGARKGKKRAVAEEEAEAEEPKKKVKGANGKALSSQTGKNVSDRNASGKNASLPSGKSGNAIPGDSDAPSKSKKRKASSGSDPIPPPILSTPPVPVAEVKDRPRKSKASANVAAKVTTPKPAADESTPKGKKKNKSRTEDSAELPSQDPEAVGKGSVKAAKAAPSETPRVSETELTPVTASKKKRSKTENARAPTEVVSPSPADASKKGKGTKTPEDAADSTRKTVTRILFLH